MENKATPIIKLEHPSMQTSGNISKILGLMNAKYMVSIIDTLDLDANPRSSKTGPVTDSIQESIERDAAVFPFKTKGLLLAASRYEQLERGRIRIIPENPAIEGILDGGHNTLAIGLYILKKAMDHAGKPLPSGNKTWDEFKHLWVSNRASVDSYIAFLKENPDFDSLNFLMPIELLVPRDLEDFVCVESFKNDLLEICAARNNNVQLQVSAKANQLGYFDALKDLMASRSPVLCQRIEWKTNDGGDIKVQDLIALAWIPLALIDPVKDKDGKVIEAVSANKLYSAKGACLKQFERLMSSPDVTSPNDSDYRHELKNVQIYSAFQIAVELPELYDYIYTEFPSLYNATGGSYGRITTVKSLNENRREKRAPFSDALIEALSPDGFIIPLFYGLQALMECTTDSKGQRVIRWTQPPMPFLHSNLKRIVKNYAGIFSMCEYDPQKIGKNPQSYKQALDSFKMAANGLLDD